MDIDLKSKIRSVPDFPKPGVNFRDITTILHDPYSFQYVIDKFAEYCKGKVIDVVIGIESRGFIFS